MSKNDTEKNKELFLENLPKYNGHIGKTCAAVGISRGIFYVWESNDIKFKEKYLDYCESKVDDGEETVKRMSEGIPDFDKDGNWIGWKVKPNATILKLYMQSKAKHRGFGQSIEITGEKKEASKMSDAEIIAELERAKKQLEEDEWDTSKDED